MSDLDAELLERIIRWCAEAGRQTGAAEVRAAVSPLAWDELLNVRALLADPPPARPLGPLALADLARGTPADIAAEREREGRYRPEPGAPGAEVLGEPTTKVGASPASGAARPRRGARRPAAPVVHRKRDQPAPTAPPPSTSPAFERLLDPEGRAVLERLIRDHGVRRAFLLAELARWRRADGTPPAEADLDVLLDHHGLARAFAHRERDELMHALRVARGDRTAAAAALGLAPPAYHEALARLGAMADAERVRAERRAELRARATIAERCRLLAGEAGLLEDLELLSEIEADLRARLGEHLRALASAPGSLAAAFARSISLEEGDALALAARLGVALPHGRTAASAPQARAPGRASMGAGRGARPPPRSAAGPGRGARPPSRSAAGPGRGARPPPRSASNAGRGGRPSSRPAAGAGRTGRTPATSRGGARGRPTGGKGRGPRPAR